jgi:hypothetical protein
MDSNEAPGAAFNVPPSLIKDISQSNKELFEKNQHQHLNKKLNGGSTAGLPERGAP